MTEEEFEMHLPGKLNPFMWNGKKRRIRRNNRSSFIFQIIFALLFSLVFIYLNILIAYQQIRHGNSATFTFLWPLEVLLFGIFLIFLYLKPIIGRLRDLDSSSLWIILFFIPFVNIIFILFLMCISGTVGPNTYGPPQMTSHETITLRSQIVTPPAAKYPTLPLSFFEEVNKLNLVEDNVLVKEATVMRIDEKTGKNLFEIVLRNGCKYTLVKIFDPDFLEIVLIYVEGNFFFANRADVMKVSRFTHPYLYKS